MGKKWCPSQLFSFQEQYFGHVFHQRRPIWACLPSKRFCPGGGCLTGKPRQDTAYGEKEDMKELGTPNQVRLNPARQSATMIFFIMWG